MRLVTIWACLGWISIHALAMQREAADFPDLADRALHTFKSGIEYRIGVSGMCGTIDDGHILITTVLPGSPADGKIREGDMIRAFQYREVAGTPEAIHAITAKRYFRLGRDWDWHLYVTVERPGLRDGKGNQLTFDLLVPDRADNVYHFGPLGMFGRIQSDGIVVDTVVQESPADGHLQVGDRIVGVGEEPVSGDVFQRFTEGVDRAESAAGGGQLTLMVRRADTEDGGQRTEVGGRKSEVELVSLQLQVLGSYGETTPINCPKTDAIITQTADGIAERGKYGRIGTSLIALLATGEEKYIGHVSNVIHSADWARPDLELPITGSAVSWHRAYKTITLCEYYLLTGDTTVLPAITAYAGIIARGQDVAGLWNHQSANPDANFGQLHGRLYGYGAINQTSIALWIGLILAEECGVKDPEVRAAVDKTYQLYRYWINRGRLPYGNHDAGEDFFTNNGTSGSVAVGFALLDDLEGAGFFSKLSAAATAEILTGHTGPWFNQFWSGLGANVAGPEALKAHVRELHWLRTVTRTWDGRFLNMEARGCEPGDYGLGSSGSMLLNLAAGRRVLRITGRGMDQSLWLDAEAARQVVDAATIDYGAQSVDSLLGLLGHELPPVRLRASEMLAIKDVHITDTIMQLLTDGTRSQRIGAIHAIASLKISSAVEALMQIAKDGDEDLWIRQLALRTITELDGADRCAPALLTLLVAGKTNDVQGRLDQDLGQALVALTASDPYAAGLDKDLLYRGVNKLLQHKRQEARGAGMSLLQKMPVEDLDKVADQMIKVIEDRDRTYVSYHGDGHRQMGLDILYGLGIDESLDLTLDTIHEKVGRGWRARNRKDFIKTWGAEARRVIPKIKDVLGKEAEPYIESIQEAKTGKAMTSLRDAILVSE